MITFTTLSNDFNEYFTPILADYQSRLFRYTQPKIMRDVLWGFNHYKPYELALIDCPLFQRLRNIYQTSLALFTYPCATHSRFEHSLGAAAVASRILNELEERRGHLDPILKLEVRIATLFHDLGQGPLSHSSEKFFERLVDDKGLSIFESLKSQNSRLFAEASASEILTYLIITTNCFENLWSQICDVYKSQEPCLKHVKLDRMASMILGIDEMVGDDDRFYRQIVNGPFDADKLDYLPRDGYFTGLEIVVDIERLWHTITVVQKDGKTDLGVVSSGASVLEQIIFAKTQLFTSMYHHHKVRAAHRLFQCLLDNIYHKDYKPAGLSLKNLISYVALDDYDLLHSGHNDPEINSIVQKLKRRILPKRALVITYPCFDEDESRENFNKLDETDFKKIEAAVENNLHLSEGDVLLDVPDQARLFGTAQAVVQISSDRILLLQDIYPAGAWAKAYAGYRRVAYIFTTVNNRRAVGEEARKILESQQYSIKLNDTALALAKIDS